MFSYHKAIPRFGLRGQIVTALLLALIAFALAPNVITHALSTGDLSFTLVTGEDGVGQKLTVDSNNCPTDGPSAAYVGFDITNTSGGILYNVEATLSGFDTANGFGLTGGQAATQYIGTMAAGETRTLYWYVAYPCNTTGLTDTVTLSVDDDGAGGDPPLTTTANLITDSQLSANAGGLIQSATLGPGYVVGQVINYTVTYEFGNIAAGDEFYLQPSGSPSFDAACLQLVETEVTASAINAIPVGTHDQLYFQAPAKQTGQNQGVTISYSFLYLCSGVSSTAVPYSTQTSGGTNMKYSGNYEAAEDPLQSPILPPIPPATNPFTVDKSAVCGTPPQPCTSLPSGVGGSVTYTVRITNTSIYSSYISQIDDTIPDGVTYTGIDPSSDITTLNSGYYPTPPVPGPATLSFGGVPLTSYLVPPGGTIDLVYNATVSGDPDIYTNTAEVYSGVELVGTDTWTVTVANQADLEVDKTVSPAAVNVGQSVTFTVTLRNNGGPDTAHNIEVTDVVPAGLTGVTVTPSVGTTWNSGTNVWSVPSLAPDATATLTITGTASVVGSIVNTAQVTDVDEADPDSTPGDDMGDDYDTATLTVNPTADLRLDKTVTITPTNIGYAIQYVVRLDNDGPSMATGVQVTDVIPSGLTGVTVTPGVTSDTPPFPTSWTSGTSTWSIPALGSGEYVTLTINATVNVAGTDITNGAEVTAAGQYDPDSTPNNHILAEDDQDEETVTIAPAADLAIDKVVNPTTASSGDTVTFTLTVTNNGPNTCTGFTVTDDELRNASTNFENFSASGDGTFNPAAGTWTYSGSIAAGGSVSIDIQADVSAGASLPVTNTATITATNEYDHNNTNDSDTATVFPSGVSTVDLGITKTLTSSDPVNVNGVITFEIVLTNHSTTTDATGIVVTDTIPAGFNCTSGNTGGVGSFSCATGVWSGFDLSASTSATLTLTGTADLSAANSTLTNIVAITSLNETDSNNANDQASDTVDVNPAADLTLTKAVTVVPTNLGNPIEFTVTLTNNGPDTATNIDVADPIPAGVSGATVTLGTPSMGSPATSYGAGTWQIPQLLNGESVTLTIAGTANTTETITNSAEVTYCDQYDPDSPHGNNEPTEDDQDSASTTVGGAADLRLTKSVNPPSAQVGDIVTYTVTLYNDGPDTATGVTVEDILPANFTPTLITPGPGTSWSDPTWSIPTLNSGANVSLTITGTVDAAGTITNNARVMTAGQFDPDSTPGNNVPSEDDQASSTVAVTLPSADLSVVKTIVDQNPDPVIYGGTIDYRIVVSNAGPDDATGVTIQDLLPAGVGNLVILSITEGTYNGNTWGTLSIPAGGSDTLEFRVTVTDSDLTITNTAQVSTAGQTDPDSTPGNNNPSEDDQSSVSVSIPGAADLELNKISVPSSSVSPGDIIQYTLTLTNDGPDPATGVIVTDILPTDVTFVSVVSIPGGTTFDGTTWDLSGISVPVGDTVLIFTVQVNAGASELINRAEVSVSDQTDPDSTPGNMATNPGEDDQATTNVQVEWVALTLDKIVDDATPNVGDTITFTLTVTNSDASTIDATGVGVVDKLPPGLDFISASGDGTYDDFTGVWSIGTIPIGGTATLTITARVLAPYLPLTIPGSYTNYAQITSSDYHVSNATPDNDSGLPGVPHEPDDDTVVVTPQVANLILTKVISTSAIQVLGQVTYTVTLTNNGTADATGVTVSEPILPGMTYVGAVITGGGAFDETTGIWDVGTLPAGNTVILQLTVAVTTPGIYQNTAQVASSDQFDPDSTPANNAPAENDQASRFLTASAAPVPPSPPSEEPSAAPAIRLGDPAISKVGEPQQAAIGETVIWTVQIWNPGSSPTNPVVFSDAIPAIFDIINVVATRGTVTISGNVVTVDIGVLQPGETVSIVIETVANTLAMPGEVCNTGVANLSSATDCITMYPDHLPETGFRPPTWAWWIGGVAASALAGGWLLIRRRWRIV